MIKSMTGFGQGRGQAAGVSFKVEMRSVNNRFREVTVKLPRFLLSLEERVKARVAEEVNRGRVEVWVNLEGQAARLKPSLNLELARGYLAALTELKDRLALPGLVDLALLCQHREIIEMAEEPPDLERLWPGLEAGLAEALAGLAAMRATEGERLAADLLARLDLLARYAATLAQAAPGLVAAAQARLRERLANLLGGPELDPQRLAQEAAILADKADITEEIVRLESHLAQFRQTLAEGGPVGRKLDFLVQELAREINTSGVKLAQAELSARAVEAKAELEKIREQVQNLE